MKHNLFRRRLNEEGFTVIEFLIASTVFIVVMAAGSEFFGSLNSLSTRNVQVTEMQQDIRAAMITLVRDISMAGYGTTSTGVCSNALTPTNSSSGPDSIDIATFGTLATTLSAATSAEASSLSLVAQTLGTISINGIRTVTAIAGTGNDVNISPILPPGESYPAGTAILTANCIQYSLDTATRELTRTVDGTGSVLAEGIIDIQFAYALDADGDGLIDDADSDGAFDTDDFINNPSAANLDNIRLVRVSIISHTLRPDPKYSDGAPLTLEDHNPTSDTGYSIADYQAYRSRLLTRIVRPRNIGLP
ncbi:PilW family protein [Nitrospira defluvii]|nr:PilW family protein [Nitrospira defluvii]